MKKIILILVASIFTAITSSYGNTAILKSYGSCLTAMKLASDGFFCELDLKYDPVLTQKFSENENTAVFTDVTQDGETRLIRTIFLENVTKFLNEVLKMKSNNAIYKIRFKPMRLWGGSFPLGEIVNMKPVEIK